MNKKQIAEIAFDIQNGLGRTDAPEFDKLRVVGMAASLAIHIRGLGEIDYEVLRKCSDHFFDIPSYALKEVIEVLLEVEFVDVVGSGRNFEKIIPRVPHFGDVYEHLGELQLLEELNEHEQASLHILGQLQLQPQNKDRLFSKSGMDQAVFDRCLVLGEHNGLVRSHRARGKNILVSPVYFSDNLDGLADLAASNGASDVKKALEVIKNNQGWPLSIAISQGEIGGVAISTEVSGIIKKLACEGILKPPTIKFNNAQESFLFTPRPGNTRLDTSNRDVYERAMALVSSVRKGQLLPDAIKIKWPLSILRALRDRGFLGSNSDANAQYRNLVGLRVGYLKEVSPGRWEFHMRKDPENKAALKLAIELLETGDLAGMELNQDARLALRHDEKYIQSVVAASELRRRELQAGDERAHHEFEQLLITF